MDNEESMKEYIARAKSLALNVQYYDIEATEQEISRRVLSGLPPAHAPVETETYALLVCMIQIFRELLQYWNRPSFPLSVLCWGKLSS